MARKHKTHRKLKPVRRFNWRTFQIEEVKQDALNPLSRSLLEQEWSVKDELEKIEKEAEDDDKFLFI